MAMRAGPLEAMRSNATEYIGVLRVVISFCFSPKRVLMGVRAHACCHAHARSMRVSPEGVPKVQTSVRYSMALLQKVSSEIRDLRDLIGLEFRDT